MALRDSVEAWKFFFDFFFGFFLLFFDKTRMALRDSFEVWIEYYNDEVAKPKP
jgi:hypothetical protein